MIEFIEDIHDPRIAIYHNVKDRELAAEGDLFIAQGLLVVQRLLRSRYQCVSVLCAQRKLETLRPDLPAGVPVFVVPDSKIHDIIGFKFHTGVMAVGRRGPRTQLQNVIPTKPALTLVVLPSTNNVENLGSIARIAAAFDVDALILGEQCADPFYRQAIRVSMGTLFTLPLHRSDNLKNDLQTLKDNWGAELIATVVGRPAEPLASARRSNRLALLLGGEFEGLTTDYLSLCPRHVTIPMAPAVDSLNVSVATGIFLYHFTQLNHPR